ncbi:hypothetical protein F511_43258 [Dorcoceras hygrometricum]|uniref:Uncharacterized protein n=1 Tax=Dorcoceras hygrometricum TaxID=472368 RepID=A0A2Z7B850_9LAMI|nr:hypothetical protein F511_43258 [Dorcoceras hygrometricum]
MDRIGDYLPQSTEKSRPDEGVSVLVMDRIGDYLPQSTEKSRVLVIRLESGTSASKMVQRSHETENRTDISFAEFAALDFPVFTSETDRMFETGTAYLVEEPIEETEQNQGTEIADAVPTADAKIFYDESMTLEEHLSTIPDGSSLPSTTAEVTKIQFGKSITIRGVDEGDWYKDSLPKIPAADKWKAPLQERDPIKGNPAKEIFSLICADIDFKRLAALKIEDIYAKEEQVLIWAETDSNIIAIQRKMYILTKYRELLLRKFLEARKTNFVPGESSSAIELKVLDMLSNLHLFVLEELKTKMQAHGLIWEMTCCSRIFEGPHRDQGAVITRSNANIRSSCWIRTMIRVDGSWVIEPCADYWKTLPWRLIRNEILPQIAYVDTLPPIAVEIANPVHDQKRDSFVSLH